MDLAPGLLLIRGAPTAHAASCATGSEPCLRYYAPDGGGTVEVSFGAAHAGSRAGAEFAAELGGEAMFCLPPTRASPS